MRLKKQFIGAFLIALLIGLTVLFAHAEFSGSREIARLSDSDYADIQAEFACSDSVLLPDALRLEGEPVPYDAESGVYYISQPLNAESFSGRLTYESLTRKAYFCPDALLASPSEAISSGHVFTLIVTWGKRYSTLKVVFTGLPILSMETNARSVIGASADETPGYFYLFDPNQGSYRITTLPMTYRLRGETSRTFSKKPYRLNCYNASSHRLQTNLLGLGTTDEWNLNALYHDATRLRDMVGLSLWNEIAAGNAAHDPLTDQMKFVELFIDHQYMGIYGLTLPLAASAGQIPDLECLIKAEYSLLDETLPSVVSSDEAFEGAAVVKWPRSRRNDDSLLSPLRRYLAANTVRTDASFEELNSYVDLENSVDVALFYQMIAANDQRFRNNYYAYVQMDDGTLRYQKIPYDLTISWGGPLTEEAYILSGRVMMEYAEKDLMFFDMQAMLGTGNQNVSNRLAARWRELRKTVFSEVHLRELFKTNMDVLTESGALSREAERWSKYPVSPDLTEINTFISKRLSYLDGYFSALEN